jgi:dihydroxy-acid dehydratase
MSSGLSRRLTEYGDAGFARFLREAFLKARGLTDEALDRPIVGICSTASDFNPCHSTAPQLIAAIERGVMLAGGLPFTFPTISLHESFAYPTSMFLRNLMAMDTEEMLRALPLDAVVLVGGCDKTVPAQIMGAVSADVPALMAVVGPMLTGSDEGERLGACTDCRRLWSAHRAGDIDDAKLARAQGRLMSSHGTCMVMGTASTMAAMAETLGFMLPGGTTIPAVHSERLRFAEDTGTRAVALARTGAPLPSQLMTKPALHNAMVVLQALGGSTNAVIHLAAMAGRAGIAMDYEAFDRIGRETPVLVDLKPIGRGYMEDLHRAGGIPAVMRKLKDRLDLSVTMADGRSLGNVLDAWPAWVDDSIIRDVSNPVAPGEALAILHGSLAPGRGRAEARRGKPEPAQPRRPRARLRRPRRYGQPHRRSRPRRDAGPRSRPARRRSGRGARHARSGLRADPQEARQGRRQGHGARLRRPHERHRLRHRHPPYRARSGRGRSHRAGGERRPGAPRRRGPAH